MVRHTIFCEGFGDAGSSVFPDREEAGHLFRVFRAREGDEVELLDGRGRRGIALIRADRRLELVSVEQISEPVRKHRLYCAVAKRNKFEGLLKQCAELGVWSIVPVKFERSVADGDRSGGRWQVLLREGCKQSKNPFLPEIREPVCLEEALCEMKKYHSFYGGIGEASGETADDGRDAAFLVGPEGGFTDRELDAIRASGVKPLNLGPYVLRLETAAVCGMAVLRRLLPVFLLSIALLCGCGRPAGKNHPLMLKGTQYRNEGNYGLALKFYRACWEKHPRSPEVVLALAQLYDENLNQPVQAWFFYEEYLNNPPEGADLTLARNARDLVRLRLGRVLEKDSTALAELQKENADLRKQLALLRRYILQLRSRPRTLKEPEISVRPPSPAGQKAR